MRFCVLGSGSKGNATCVLSGSTVLLIDSGFSGVEMQRRLDAIGIDIAKISAILVTHEHGDHIKGVSVLSRRHGIPVYANADTRKAAGPHLAKLFSFTPFVTGKDFEVGDFLIHPFSISHDAVDPVGFTLSDGTSTLGYCTDTGHISKLISHHLSSCQGVVLECNHDLEMLRNGHYPQHVQQRVRSQKGHLANPQTLDFLRKLYHNDLRAIVLAHISESNNSFALVQETMDTFLEEISPKLHQGRPHIGWAHQDTVSPVIELGDDLEAWKILKAC